jgi:hypothetical protein
LKNWHCRRWKTLFPPYVRSAIVKRRNAQRVNRFTNANFYSYARTFPHDD